MRHDDIDQKLRTRVRAAVLRNGSIVPAFQPIINLDNGKVSSFEVLARWIDEAGGTISPSTFIPIIEQEGLLDRMTDQLVRTACRNAIAWEGEFRLAFNISPSQFLCPNLVSRIRTASDVSGFPAHRLQIEITENAILDDSDIIKHNVDALKREGIRLLLDDFGTGYSSLTRLQAVPFDKIKIDAGFVSLLETRRDSRKIVSAVIGLGHSLGQSIVAEGVENENQLRILRTLGCDYGQGYHFSRPVFAEAVPDLLRARGQAAHDPKPLEMSCNRKIAELDNVYHSDRISICYMDNLFRLISISESFCRQAGIVASAVTGRHIREVFPGNADLVRCASEAMRDDNDTRSRHLILATHRGLLSLELRTVRDESLDVVGFSLFSVDQHANPEAVPPWGDRQRARVGVVMDASWGLPRQDRAAPPAGHPAGPEWATPPLA